MAREQFDVCIVGGGPAGAVTGLRLAQLGHRVCLVERSVFPRVHVGESLTGGIWPIFDVLGVGDLIQQEEFLNTPQTLIRWAQPRTETWEPSQRGGGLLVDRSRFDGCLLAAASNARVRVFQPGRIQRINATEAGWRVEVGSNGESHEIDSTFLVDASGRNGFAVGKRVRASEGTVALCGYVGDQDYTKKTLVEALSDSWCWGAPVPGELFSAMVFLDRLALRPVSGTTLEASWRSHLARTELFEKISRSPLVRPLVACDATTYFMMDPIEPSLVRVGEASFSLDPLSSTGVEKAMQSGLIAAIVLHTMILRPESIELCLRFYRERQKEAVATHAVWSAGFYSEVKRFSEFPFWKARSGTSQNRQPTQETIKASYQLSPLNLDAAVRISEDAQFAEEPCIIDNQVHAQTAVRHPRLDRPVAFVEGIGIGRLLEMVPGNPNLRRLIAIWSNWASPQLACRIATWLVDKRILEAI